MTPRERLEELIEAAHERWLQFRGGDDGWFLLGYVEALEARPLSRYKHPLEITGHCEGAWVRSQLLQEN